MSQEWLEDPEAPSCAGMKVAGRCEGSDWGQAAKAQSRLGKYVMCLRKRGLSVRLPRSGNLDRVQRGQGSQEAEMSAARDRDE